MRCERKQPLSGEVNLWPVDRAVLMLILRKSLGPIPSHELIAEIRESPDVVEYAIDALVGAGLARREHGCVVPTRAAVRFDELGV